MAKFNKLDVPYQWKDEFTKYPHGYTIFEALCKWTKQVDSMVDNVNDWNNYLDGFVDNFEFELQEEVQETIARWQDEGKLEDIISSALNTRLDVVEDDIVTFKSELESDVSTFKSELLDNLNERAVNITSFGAIGDWTDGVGTDNTDAIEAAIDYLDGKGKILIPSGSFMFSRPITISSGITVEGVGQDSILVYNGLRNSGKALIVRSNCTLNNFYLLSAYSQWDLVAPLSGIYILDGNQNFIENITIEGFEYGIHLHGEVGGTAYNQIRPKMIRNCYYGVYFTQKTGWTNENSFYGGRLHIDSDRRMDGTHGVYMSYLSQQYYPNGNKFFGQSIEGFYTGMHIEGTYNFIYGPRIEAPSSGVMIDFKDTATGLTEHNCVFGGYGVLNVYAVRHLSPSGEVRNYTRNTVFGRGRAPVLEEGIYLHSYRKSRVRYDVTADEIQFFRDYPDYTLLGLKPNRINFYNNVAHNFLIPSGTSSNRPNPNAGRLYFDTTLGKPIFGNGSSWVDANGSGV